MSLATTTDATFDQEVLESPSPVLVKFTADWCPPCFMVAPVLDRIAVDEADRLVVSVDYDLNPEISQRYHVLGSRTLGPVRAGRDGGPDRRREATDRDHAGNRATPGTEIAPHGCDTGPLRTGRAGRPGS